MDYLREKRLSTIVSRNAKRKANEFVYVDNDEWICYGHQRGVKYWEIYAKDFGVTLFFVLVVLSPFLLVIICGWVLFRYCFGGSCGLRGVDEKKKKE